MTGRAHQSLMDRFFRFANAHDDDCWIWSGSVCPSGYGYLTCSRDRYLYRIAAHRFSWELHNAEEIPVGLLAIHSCDRRACVNPRHIRVGTALDNSKDMLARGRNRHVAFRGEANALAILTEDSVRAIKSMRGTVRTRDVAEMYGVATSTIGMIWSGKNWRHVPWPNHPPSQDESTPTREELHA